MVTATLERRSFEQLMKALNTFAYDMKITMKDAMLEQAALACQDAAIFTPPLTAGGGGGLSSAAFRAGLKAVEGDIRKIFTAMNDRGAKNAASLATNQMAFAVKSNDIGAFNNIVGGGKMLRVEGLNPIVMKISLDPNRERAFTKAKNFFNRVNPTRNEYGTQGFVHSLRPIHDKTKGRFGGRMKRGQFKSNAKLLVEDKSELNDYIRSRQQAVGTVKSGWAAALSTLPPPTDNNGQSGDFGAELRKTAWVSGKRSVAGYNVSTFTDSNVQIRIVNSLGNVNGVADDANTLSLVYGNRVKQMPAQVRYRTQKPVNKFNSK